MPLSSPPSPPRLQRQQHGNGPGFTLQDHSTSNAIAHRPHSPEALPAPRSGKVVAKEIARMLLPQNLYTQAYWTVSLQGVLHFLDQRLKPDAQYEIRRFAEAVRDLVAPDLERLGVRLS